jgi:hypothetical protein
MLLIVFTAAPLMAQPKNPDEDTNAGAVIVDFACIRPLGVAATVLGSVLYVLTAPFAAAGGNTDQTAEVFVKNPAKFTFERPLGHL